MLESLSGFYNELKEIRDSICNMRVLGVDPSLLEVSEKRAEADARNWAMGLTKEQLATNKIHFIMDGGNVAASNRFPSQNAPNQSMSRFDSVTLVRALYQANQIYGHTIAVMKHAHDLYKPFQHLIDVGLIVTAPRKHKRSELRDWDDYFILNLSWERCSYIISNELYRNHFERGYFRPSPNKKQGE